MTLVARVLGEAVRARAVELGFDRVAIGPAGRPEHGAAFERWLDAGYAGEMGYLERTRAERLDPAILLPGCRSVVATAVSYNASAASASATSTEGPNVGRGGAPTAKGEKIARYAHGRDYHDVLKPRLVALGDYIREAAGGQVASRPAVDTSAVLERDLAARAGLGWIGKNTNLLTPSLGSYFFIGIVLTTAELAFDERLPDRCGTCTACLDACPTGAFVEPYVLDARRCISYLTIEHRGHVPAELRAGVGEWLFGCDVCQDVCPWNRKAEPGHEPALAPSAEIDSLESLLQLDDVNFRARFRGTAMARTKRAGLLRNAAIVLGNRGNQSAVGALTRALDDRDDVVRQAAAWALERLAATASTP